MPELNYEAWEEFLKGMPQAHLLQGGSWGELKRDFGWDVMRIAIDERERRIGGQLLFRRLPLGFSLAYLPRGPVSNDPALVSDPEFWASVDAACRKRRAIFLKVEPDRWLDSENLPDQRAEDAGNPAAIGCPAGFVPGLQSIQPPRTILVDLQGGEEAVLMRMKQKTRYNIRLAGKKEIRVASSSDIDAFYSLMEKTGERDNFGVHSQAYYRRAYELFHPRQECELLMAWYGEELLAGIMVFARGERAWYFYGASSDHHRDRMPTYLVQWEGIRWAMQRGCHTYDLWGVPDASQDVLESEFEQRSTGLWGVYRFKRGFGGKLLRTMGPWDRTYNPALYQTYRLWLGRRGGNLG